MAESKYTLQENDYLELWEYFESRADELKGTMYENVTWVIGFAAAVLGFILDKFIKFDTPVLTVQNRKAVIGLTVIGLVLCVYAFFLLRHYAKHIKRNWQRSNRCKAEVNGLERIITGRPLEPNDGSLTRNQTWVGWQAELVVLLFFLAFIAIVGFVFASS